jgi:hypothetical protein
MLFPFIILGVLIVVGRAVSKPRITAYEDFVRRRMEIKFYDIKHRIEYCGTVTALEDLTNDIIEYFDLYKYEPGIKGNCGQLHSMIENRRIALRNMRNNRA